MKYTLLFHIVASMHITTWTQSVFWIVYLMILEGWTAVTLTSNVSDPRSQNNSELVDHFQIKKWQTQNRGPVD